MTRDRRTGLEGLPRPLLRDLALSEPSAPSCLILSRAACAGLAGDCSRTRYHLVRAFAPSLFEHVNSYSHGFCHSLLHSPSSVAGDNMNTGQIHMQARATQFQPTLPTLY